MITNNIKRAYWFVKHSQGEEIWDNEDHFYFFIKNTYGITRTEWDEVFPKGTSLKEKEALMY